MVMQYASEGDLHNYLQKKFTEIKWNRTGERKSKSQCKSTILWQISEGYLYLDIFIHY